MSRQTNNGPQDQRHSLVANGPANSSAKSRW